MSKPQSPLENVNLKFPVAGVKPAPLGIVARLIRKGGLHVFHIDLNATPYSDPVNAAKRELFLQFVREFFTKIHYVIYCAAFTAAQVSLASGFYYFEVSVALFAKQFGSPRIGMNLKSKTETKLILNLR